MNVTLPQGSRDRIALAACLADAESLIERLSSLALVIECSDELEDAITEACCLPAAIRETLRFMDAQAGAADARGSSEAAAAEAYVEYLRPAGQMRVAGGVR